MRRPERSEITLRLRDGPDVKIAHAFLKRKAVGIFMFRVTSIGENILLRSVSTEVNPRYQKLGIGTQLWEFALKTVNPTAIEVYPVTPAGEALVCSLQQKHPNLDWMDR